MSVVYYGLSNGYVEFATSARALCLFEKVAAYLRKTPAAVAQRFVPLARTAMSGHTLKRIIDYAECNADPATSDDEKMAWCVAALQKLTFDESIALYKAARVLGYAELACICEQLINT